jgi:hypothetical protein
MALADDGHIAIVSDEPVDAAQRCGRQSSQPGGALRAEVLLSVYKGVPPARFGSDRRLLRHLAGRDLRQSTQVASACCQSRCTVIW